MFICTKDCYKLNSILVQEFSPPKTEIARKPMGFRLNIESLSKPRLWRQREHHQTKGLISKTMGLHVRYKSLYIS